MIAFGYLKNWRFEIVAPDSRELCFQEPTSIAQISSGDLYWQASDSGGRGDVSCIFRFDLWSELS